MMTYVMTSCNHGALVVDVFAEQDGATKPTTAFCFIATIQR